LILLLSLACAKEREPAPPDLDQLLRASFRDWEAPDEIAVHAVDLAVWLVDSGGDPALWDGLQVSNLDDDDLVSVEVPDGVDLSMHRGVTTAFQSAFPASAHAALAVEPDQRWTDPAFVRYDRTVIEGDPATFPDGGDGELLRTSNDVEKSGAFGIRIPCVLRKDYRWADAAGARALVVRWWLDEPGCSDNGKNCLIQSFGFEILVDRPAGAHRLLTNWIEVRTEADALLSEDARIGLIAKGNQDLLEETERTLSER